MKQNLKEEKLVRGESTLAEFVGLDKAKQYEIAMKGYKLMEIGRLEEAEKIYKGLVAADPYDSVFHCQLGAILFKTGRYEEAMSSYDSSIELNKANVDALAARGEIHLMNQEFEAGIEDLQKSVEIDPRGSKQSSIRARAILLSLRDAVEKRQSAAGLSH